MNTNLKEYAYDLENEKTRKTNRLSHRESVSKIKY
jgi:hypothetical protein